MKELRVETHDDLIAAVPHVLGFTPQESVVLLPLTRGLPVVRVDLPKDERERTQLWENLKGPLRRNVERTARMVVVCFTEDRDLADRASRHLGRHLGEIGVRSHRMWASELQWTDLDTSATGARSTEAVTRMAATAAYEGHTQPVQSRQLLADSLVGNRDHVAAELTAARAAARMATPGEEATWVTDRVRVFHSDGGRLTDHEAARMLAATTDVAVRDAVWQRMTRNDIATDVALWTDLTRRAPDDVRAPAASLLAFASWLEGDGARAWCALDQVPGGYRYTMAAVVAAAVQTGMSPDQWEGRIRSDLTALATELDAAFRPPGETSGSPTQGSPSETDVGLRARSSDAPRR